MWEEKKKKDNLVPWIGRELRHRVEIVVVDRSNFHGGLQSDCH